jgi:hypothetical protein
MASRRSYYKSKLVSLMYPNDVSPQKKKKSPTKSQSTAASPATPSKKVSFTRFSEPVVEEDFMFDDFPAAAAPKAKAAGPPKAKGKGAPASAEDQFYSVELWSS